MRRKLTVSIVTTISLFALASCGGGTSAPSGETSDASSEAAAAAAPKIEVAFQGEGTDQEFYITNREAGPLTVKRLIFNNLPDDKSCTAHVFATLKPGEGKQVPAGTCGTILHLTIETDKGNYEQSWDPNEGKLSARINADSIEVINGSTDSMRIDRIVLNGREGDSACDIKVFESINSKDSSTVAYDGGCGKVQAYKIYANYKGKDTQFDFQRPPEDASGDEAM